MKCGINPTESFKASQIMSFSSASKEPLANVEEDHGEEEMEEEELDEQEQEQGQKEEEEMEKVEEEEEVAEQEESNKSSPKSTSESSTMCSPMEIQESPELFFEESDEEDTDIDVFRSPFSDTDSVDSVMRVRSQLKKKFFFSTKILSLCFDVVISFCCSN